MKGIQDENYILDLHVNVVVRGGGVRWLALHACHHSSRLCISTQFLFVCFHSNSKVEALLG